MREGGKRREFYSDATLKDTNILMVKSQLGKVFTITKCDLQYWCNKTCESSMHLLQSKSFSGH